MCGSGGGAIAFLKIGPLLQAKAAVTVVRPKIIPEIEQLYLEGEINVIRKEIEYADYKDAFLIIAATNFPEINREIYENTKDTKLINVITDSEIGNINIPATITRGKLQISVATGGASPMLAKKIRDNLKERYDDSYEEYVEFLHDARIKIKHSSLSKEEKRKLYKEAIDERYKRSKEERYRLFMQLLPFET